MDTVVERGCGLGCFLVTELAYRHMNSAFFFLTNSLNPYYSLIVLCQKNNSFLSLFVFVSFAIGVPIGQGTFFELAFLNFWATQFHALSSWPRIFALFAELFAHSSGRSGGPFRCRRFF